jgi:penicillin amidase
LPQIMNPPSHTIATANHNILPAGYRHAIGYDWTPPYRFARIQERLAAKQKFTLDYFKSMQLDNVSLVGRALAKLIREATFAEPELRALADTLAPWDGNLRRDRAPGAIYAVWLGELQTAFFRRHVPERLLRVVNVPRNIPVMMAALENPSAEWFGDKPVEARNRLLQESFASAARKLRQLLGNDPTTWTWGKLHTVTFRHALSPLSPAYAEAFNLGPRPRPGDGLTPNAASYNTKYEQISGATYRHVLDLADWDRGRATSAPGQSGQPGSPHYADLLPLWDKGEYFPLLFSRPQVEKAARHRLVLKPA